MSNTRTWTLGAVALMVVVVIAGYMLGISPIMSQIDTANQQTATIQSSNAASQAQLASLRIQYAGIGKLKSRLDTLRESIPELEDASTFFNELTALSATYGVTVTNLTLASAVVYAAPSAPAPATTPSTSTDSSTASPAPTTPSSTPVATSSNGLVSVPVGLTVQGPFDATRDFVGALQTGTRLIFISSTSFSAGGDGSATATIAGNIFTLQGTSDVVSKQKLIPTPTATATPTATPTPTPTSTTTTSSSKAKSTPEPTTAPDPVQTTDPTPDPTPTS